MKAEAEDINCTFWLWLIQFVIILVFPPFNLVHEAKWGETTQFPTAGENFDHCSRFTTNFDRFNKFSEETFSVFGKLAIKWPRTKVLSTTSRQHMLFSLIIWLSHPPRRAVRRQLIRKKLVHLKPHLWHDVTVCRPCRLTTAINVTARWKSSQNEYLIANAIRSWLWKIPLNSVLSEILKIPAECRPFTSRSYTQPAVQQSLSYLTTEKKILKRNFNGSYIIL